MKRIKEKSMNRLLRVLSLYERLQKGEILVKKREAEYFCVDPRTIQRDLEDIRNYLAEHHCQSITRLIYDRRKKGYVLEGSKRSWLTNAELLIISKVLLESRFCPKEEMDTLLNKLILQAVPEERDHLEDLLLNEKHHYVPVSHNKPLIQISWELSRSIQQKRIVEMEYKSVGKEANRILVKPVGLIFSEYYFYLLAYLTEYSFDFPTVFRIDRILTYIITEESFRIPYLERFEEGEFRKRVQFMYPGQLMRVHLIYRGNHREAILDRLPTAEILKEENGETHIRAEVYGWGIRMWILSQGASLEVIKPEDFRQEIQETIQHMDSLYQR